MIEASPIPTKNDEIDALIEEPFAETLKTYEAAQKLMKIALEGCGFPLEYLTSRFASSDLGPVLLIDFNYDKLGMTLNTARNKLGQVDLSDGNSAFYALRTLDYGMKGSVDQFGLGKIPLFDTFKSYPGDVDKFFRGKNDQELLDVLLSKYSPTELEGIKAYMRGLFTRAQRKLSQST